MLDPFSRGTCPVCFADTGTLYGPCHRCEVKLRAAFDLVAPTDNWKKPIDRTLSIEALRMLDVPFPLATLRYAIIHYTGACPGFAWLPGHAAVRVTAAGYYEAIGA